MAVQESVVTLQTESGPMQGYLVLPERKQPAPAVIVIQEIFGVNESIMDACLQLGREGYVALAPELFHRSAAAGQVFPYDFALVQPHFAKLTNDGIAEDVAVARGFLAAHARVQGGRIAILGFCAGGYVTWQAACGGGVQAAVSFYGGGLVRPRPGLSLRPLLPAQPACPTLCFFGGKDQSIPASDVEAIRAALQQSPHAAASEAVVYPDAGHAFFNHERPANYHDASAKDAWARTKAFLAARLA